MDEWCEKCDVRRAVCYIGHRGMSLSLCGECEAEYRQSEAEFKNDCEENR